MAEIDDFQHPRGVRIPLGDGRHLCIEPPDSDGSTFMTIEAKDGSCEFVGMDKDQATMLTAVLSRWYGGDANEPATPATTR